MLWIPEITATITNTTAKDVKMILEVVWPTKIIIAVVITFRILILAQPIETNPAGPDLVIGKIEVMIVTGRCRSNGERKHQNIIVILGKDARFLSEICLFLLLKINLDRLLKNLGKYLNMT